MKSVAGARLNGREAEPDADMFLVNAWSPSADGSGQEPYLYVNIADVSGTGLPHDSTEYHWIGLPEMEDQTGVAGQNVTNLLSLFGEHAVVVINGKVYDPSYGQTYPNMAAFWQQAIAGFGKDAHFDPATGELTIHIKANN